MNDFVQSLLPNSDPVLVASIATLALATIGFIVGFAASWFWSASQAWKLHRATRKREEDDARRDAARRAAKERR